MSKIHPLAVVAAGAKLGNDVSIGAFAVIEEDVTIGDGCQIAAHACIKRGAILGQGNEICEGAVIGGRPQHLKAHQHVGVVKLGDGNMIREHVTIHGAMSAEAATTIGSNCLLMVGSHVAHDCVVGNHVVLTNHVLLAGHVSVGERAYLAGVSAVHQFCRIGPFVMVGGMARIVQDVPPYVTVDGGTSKIVGLNRIGLRRNGFTSEQMEDLKAAYRLIYRSGLKFDEMVASLRAQFPHGPAAALHEFFQDSKRGFTQERRAPPRATIKLHRTDDLEADDAGQARKAG